MERAGAWTQPAWSWVWWAGFMLLAVGCKQASQPSAVAEPAARLPALAASVGSDLPAIAIRARREARGPVFAWDAVAGAQDYGVMVYAASAKAPQWIWIGTHTQVRYGELPASLVDTSMPGGPSTWAPALAGGAEWQVVAMDANGSPMAISRRGNVP